jgi:hypothetical protein
MRWSFMKRNILISSLVFLFAVTCAWAQTGTTSLRGVVTDKTGATAANAKVTLTNTGQALKREMSTNNAGEYEFLALPPGSYLLTVELAGFRKFEQKNLQLLVNLPATQNVTLEVGTTTETVEVSAQVVTLNTTDASLGVAFGENQVKQLPLEGRNVPDLLSLQAGVLYTGNRSDINTDVDTRNGAVNGARSDQSNVTLDGIAVNDSGGHAFTSVLPVTLDSVQEFRVTTTNYNADQGSSSGAQVALVTKSGTNDFHGSVYEYNRNTYTSANDYFVKAAQIQGCLGSGTPLSDKQCNQAPKLIRNVFGASVGGPIKKDRFYFFLNYEGTRRLEETSAVRTIPTDSLRDGVVFYQCKNTATVATNCPGGSVKGLSGNAYAIPAPVTNSDGSITAYFAVNAAQITAMDPQHKGPNSATLTYLNSFPHPNDGSVGDGLNYSGFRFSSPISDNKNSYIAKFDYNITKDAKQRISWSGALANESNPQGQYLPSSPAGSLFNYTSAENSFVNYNKGFVINYSGVISNNLVNSFRYGFVRESVGDIGDSNQQYIILRGITQGVTRTSAFQRPIHTFADDLSWTHGRHTLQFGGSLTFIRNPRNNTLNSFSDGAANASWLDVSGMLVKCGAKGSPFCPSNNGLPAGAGSFANSYDFPMMALLGMVTEDDATYNYKKDGSVLGQGAPVQRHFAEDGWEMYAQDSWKVKSNLTVTFGLRYSLFSPPWETNGLQVSPSVNLSDWFNLRAKDMENGIPSNQDPLISYSLGGPANGGKPGLWKWDYHDLGPRLALAWSPKGSGGLLKSLFGDGGKTVIRAGFGVVYDNIGNGILDTFDSSGSFGLATTLSNPAGIETAACAPRLTDMHTIPTADLGCPANNNVPGQMLIPAPPGTFPQTFPNTLNSGGFAITWGLDQNIKTPYSYTLDFSVGRELPKGFALEVSYVGRLSHRLLTQSDLAQPLDFFDKKSGLDYFKALTALAKIYRTGVATDNFSPSMVPANVVQYWTDVLQPLEGPNAGNGGAGGAYAIGNCTTKNGPTSTTSAVVAIYDLFCGSNLNETTGLFNLDYGGISDANNVANCDTMTGPACNPSYLPAAGGNTFFNPQYSSLYAWRSNANANYHAMQVNFRHRMEHGVQFDFNYTFSKSIDISSDATRIGAWSGLGGQVINSWDPNAMRAVSDFDAKHQFNANWIAELPFGKGKLVAGNAHGVLDAIIGGWQLSGLFRITSGLPFNVFNGFNWPTNWQLGGNAYLVSPVNTGVFKGADSSGNTVVSVFKNGTAAINSFVGPFPGETGARNQIRGDGFFNVDMGLAKRWHMPWSERQSLQLRWEVFNVTNTNRFDVQSIGPELDISSTFGNYTGLLTNPRVMQFALRFEF